MGYDGDGKRASRTAGGSTTSYFYDVNRSLPVLLEDGARKYVWGLGLAYAVKSDGSLEVSHTDGLGSVRAISDGSGSVVQTYRTDEFGMSLETNGTTVQPFQYTGEQRDGESGFVYLRARMYDPQIGRFLQRDRLAGFATNPLSLNRYAYALHNPVNLVDPSGLEPAGISDRGGATDNPCFTSGGGALAGNVFSAACFAYNVNVVVELWVVTQTGLIKLPGVLAANSSPDAGPGGMGSQEHHIATDKHSSYWTSVFRHIFARAGMALNDAANKVVLPGHTGPHSPTYHEWVYSRLEGATRGLSGNEAAAALRAELEAIKTELLKNPDLIRGVGLR